MNIKRFWGVVVLIVFVVATGVFLYWQFSELHQVKKEAVEYEKLLEETGNPVGSKTLPGDATGASDKSARISDNGKSEQSDNSNKSEQSSAKSQGSDSSLPAVYQFDDDLDWHSLTPEQQQEVAQQISDRFYTQFGLEVPPRGYDYHWKEPGVPYLDENGDPVLHRLDEPI